MSWIDNIANIKFTITTGDAKVFYPLWRDSTKAREFNTTGFDFIDVPGGLFERKQPRANNYPLIFYFDGDNNIEVARDFDLSANDKRAWTVVHPIYGTIKGQPVSIGRVDNLNITEFTVDFWESLDVNYPKSNYSVKDNTLFKKDAALDSAAQSFSDKPVFDSGDIVKAKDTNVQMAASFDKVLSANPLYADDYYTEFQYATALAMKSSDYLTTNAFEYIRQTQGFLNLPARMETSVTVRLDAYSSAYGKIKTILTTIADKLSFQSNGAAILTNYAEASVNPVEGDYTTVPEVQAAANNLLAMYDDYVTTLDNAAISIYDVDNSWNPDAELQAELLDIVMYTVSNLYDLAFDAQQERIVYVDKDTNIILLVHRYMGLDNLDVNIETFRRINNIKMKELFRIKKDRQIKYYV